jgi:nitrogen regulatory protein PII 2
MKLILAIIRIAKMGDTKQALADAGLPSFTAMPVLGRGASHLTPERQEIARKKAEAAGLEYTEYPRLKSKRMITLVVTDEKKDLAVETLIKANHTGKTGDGKIFVVNTFGSYSVHTGASGDETLD